MEREQSDVRAFSPSNSVFAAAVGNYLEDNDTYNPRAASSVSRQRVRRKSTDFRRKSAEAKKGKDKKKNKDKKAMDKKGKKEDIDIQDIEEDEEIKEVNYT